VDLSDLISSPLISQGPRPTCIPFAFAWTHEAERHALTGGQFKAAIEPLWWQLDALGLTTASGVTLSAAGVALAQVGHCHSDQWPYNDALGVGTEPPPTAAGVPPWRTATLRSVSLAHDGIEDDLEHQLAAGHPVVLVLELTNSFLAPANDGYVVVPTRPTPSSGYHAVIAVGTWTDPRGRVLLIRNSWGDWWGAGGYCLLPTNYLIDFVPQAAYVEITQP
jgi:hypothetical protein